MYKFFENCHFGWTQVAEYVSVLGSLDALPLQLAFNTAISYQKVVLIEDPEKMGKAKLTEIDLIYSASQIAFMLKMDGQPAYPWVLLTGGWRFRSRQLPILAI